MLLCGVSIFFAVAAARSGKLRRHLSRLAGALALGVLFALIQVFPTLELKPLSERGTPLPSGLRIPRTVGLLPRSGHGLRAARVRGGRDTQRHRA